MRFKMRVLYYPAEGNIAKLAQAIARSQKTTADTIPLSYKIENERLLFLGIEKVGKDTPQALLDFCAELTPERARNIALFGLGRSSDIDDLLGEVRLLLTGQGIRVMNNVSLTEGKGGLFSRGTVRDEDISNVMEWAIKIVDSMTY